jgi:hypothetical protein
VRDSSAVDEKTLRESVRAIARPAAGRVHLIVGAATAQAWAAGLQGS